MKRTLVAALAVMLLLAPVLPFVAVGSAAAAPAGMATIPDGNVAEDVPSGESLALSAGELEGGVMASEHADSLEVVLTTADHAPTVMGSDSAVVAGDGMALVLRDDQQSAGREVALDAGQLQEALGYRPEAIRGTHEDGSTWTASAEYVDGYLVFDVPHFSSNTVTFSGEVTIDASGATDGTQFQYALGATDSVSDPTVTLTGEVSTQTATESWTGLSDGATRTASVGGDLEPRGPSQTEPQVSVTGPDASTAVYGSSVSGQTSSMGAAAGYYTGDLKYSTSEFTAAQDGMFAVKEIPIDGDTLEAGETGTIDVYVADETIDNDATDGTKIGEFDVSDGLAGESVSVTITDRVQVYQGQTFTLGFAPRNFPDQADDNDGVTFRGGDFDSNVGKSLTNNGESVTDRQRTVKFTGSYKPTASGSVSIGSASTSFVDVSGTVEKSIDIPAAGDQSLSVTTDNPVDVSVSYKERELPSSTSITLNGQTVDVRSGELGIGESESVSLNDSYIETDNTVRVGIDDAGSGDPTPSVGVSYNHSAADQISTNYTASTFEESYNVSHTYADATEDAQATIPFTSSRVVSVGNVEYRVDGGSWSRVASANYRLDGTTLDVYLDDATGGVDAGQTVDVRATGRKISVGNGAVTVTDPTAPGEELDTQLQIDSRSEDFHVNVGPTDDGDRVHYAYADGFPTEDYVVIDAAGNQQLYLPNAVTGDTFRVQHLDTRVVAEQGDVRIDVVKPGENPELDVSPGPGGSGDPVTVEYYNTESGVTYLLNSLTRSIVVDSDTAQSPAIFEDDDSDETWAILQDSGPSGSSSDGGGGAVGQFRETASNTLGSISLPVDGSGLGQLALVGVLGLGGVVVLRRLWPFGDDSDAVTGDTGTASESDAGLLTGVAMSLTSASQRAARTTGSGLLTALQRVLDYLGNVVSIILGNRRASIAAAVLAAIVAARVGLVQLPEGTGILIVVSGVPLATWLIMRRSDAVSRRVWLASTIAAVILGLEFVAPGTVQTAIEQLTSEQVAPLLILVGAGGLYLWYRARQSDRPQIIIGGNDE